MAFVWELTKETIDLPLACLQGGLLSSKLPGACKAEHGGAWWLTPQPSTLNPQPSTLNPQPSTLTLVCADGILVGAR